MLQRIGIAQALIGDPDLVILDEPTSALDPIGRRDVRDIIRHLKTLGKTVFLNSHLLSEVESVCDRVAIIDRGLVVREGLLTQLLSDLELDLSIGDLTPALLDSLAAHWRILHHNGGLVTLAISSESDAPAVAEIVLTHGGRLYSMTPNRQSLEEVFVQVVSRDSAEVPSPDARPDSAVPSGDEAQPEGVS
jgi:ABC-2 type transport system ATP-binding protein